MAVARGTRASLGARRRREGPWAPADSSAPRRQHPSVGPPPPPAAAARRRRAAYTDRIRRVMQTLVGH